jgi:hypothetical protein
MRNQAQNKNMFPEHLKRVRNEWTIDFCWEIDTSTRMGYLFGTNSLILGIHSKQLLWANCIDWMQQKPVKFSLNWTFDSFYTNRQFVYTTLGQTSICVQFYVKSSVEKT